MSIEARIGAVRERVGTDLAEAEITTALAVHTDPRRAALGLLRARRADLALTAARFAVAGDYSQDTTANIKALDALIGRLERELGIAEDPTALLPAMTQTPIVGPTLGR